MLFLHHHSENKRNDNYDQFPDKHSLVKIENENEFMDVYCVHFLLDNRTQYVSSKANLVHFDRWDIDISKISPGFVEYELIREDLMTEFTYIVAPFTNYLNEEIEIPDVSESEIYQLLEQTIDILNGQGFTEERQLEEIEYQDEKYDYQFM